MQSASPLPNMPWPKNLRPGQEQVLKKIIEHDIVTAKLPTGYGKTRVFAGAYAIKRAQGVCNRLLYVVPRNIQEDQAGEDLPRDLRDVFGIETKSTIIGREPTMAMRRHRKGECEVFITTIQAMATSRATMDAIKEMMGTGLWFCAIDEYHNIPSVVKNGVEFQTGKYLQALNQLPFKAELRMTATPRLDDKDPYPDPSPSVTYLQAHREGCVKEMHLHEYEYRVDGVMVNGEVVSYTTTELFESDEPESMILSGRMRWSPKYVSPLITIPAERMLDYRLRGIKTQMLVQTMMCSHAELICSQIKALLPTLEVDWVGTGPNGRSDSENKAVISRFCPKKNKNGKRPWTLDVLVNVGMAGEGLDSQDVSEIVFLTPVNKTVSNLQSMGRAARVMYDDDGNPLDVIANINVDTQTFIAANDVYLGKKIMAIFDDDSLLDEIDQEEPTQREASDDYKEMPDEPTVIIADVSLIDIRKEPGFDEMLKLVRKKEGRGRTDDECIALVTQGMEQYIEKRDAQLNATSERAQLRREVDAAVGKIVSLMARIVSKTGVRLEGSFFGDMKKRINQKKRRLFEAVEKAESDDLRKQYHWLKELEQEIRTEGVPSWLR